MKFSEETLMAYADGELDESTQSAVEEAMRSDPALAERIERHRALRAQLGAAYDGVLDQPVPQRLLDAARGSAPASVTDLAAARAARREKAPQRPWAWKEWTAIAASVLLGVFIGRAALVSPGQNWVLMSEAGLVAAGPLAAALSQQLSGAQPDDARVAIAATFRADSGEYCRAFTAGGPERLAGLACRSGRTWRVHTLTRGGAASADEGYRMAGSALPPLVLQAAETMRVAEALDAAQEAAARERGWRD